MKAGFRGIQCTRFPGGRGGKNETEARSGSSAHFGRLVRGVSASNPSLGSGVAEPRGRLGHRQCRRPSKQAARVIL